MGTRAQTTEETNHHKDFYSWLLSFLSILALDIILGWDTMVLVRSPRYQLSQLSSPQLLFLGSTANLEGACGTGLTFLFLGLQLNSCLQKIIGAHVLDSGGDLRYPRISHLIIPTSLTQPQKQGFWSQSDNKNSPKLNDFILEPNEPQKENSWDMSKLMSLWHCI